MAQLRHLAVAPLMAAALAWLALVAPVSAAPLAQEAQTFIRGLADETVTVLDDKSLATEQRVQRMADLFTRNFAVDEIAQWVLGRYWRRASPAEKQEYIRLFKDFIVYGYAQRFSDYAGQKLQVRDATALDDDTALVRSEIVLGGGQKNIQVGWRVTRDASGFQIRDVAVEGVSMAQTQRSDFAATIQQHGGTVSGLNTVLREKVKLLKSELGLAS